MSKKKPSSTNSTDAIQFRPGEHLGKIIDEIANAERISRGEVAKRLTSLAAHGLSLDFYPFAVEIEQLADEPYTFEASCEMISVRIAINEGPTQENGKKTEAKSSERLAIARNLVQEFRFLREHREEQKQVVLVQLSRTDFD